MTAEESARPSEVELQVLNTLEQRRESLISRVGEAIRAAIPAYVTHPDPTLEADVTRHVERNLDTFLATAIEGRRPNSEDLAFVREVVEKRVAQGVPLEDVLHAFRVGQQVLWETIMAESREIGVGAEVALALALPAMQYIDAASSEVTESYVRLEQRLQADSDRVRAQIVEAMIEGRWPLERTRLAAAEYFPVGPDELYLVAVVQGFPDPAALELRAAAHRVGRTRPLRGGVSDVRRGRLIAIFALDSDAPDDAGRRIADELRAVADGVGASPAIGVSTECVSVGGIADGYEEAKAAADAAGAGGSVVLPQLPLVERVAVMLATGGSADRLVPDRIQEFLAADRAEGGDLTETVLAYSACDCNARRTAERLFVHPNTILYRLRKVSERTGLDLQSVPDLVDLLTAVRVLNAAVSAEEPTSAIGAG